MIVTPTYHVFEMYSVHQDALRLPLTVEGARYEHEGRSLPAVSASASRDGQGRIHLSLTNLDPNRALSVSADLRGGGAQLSRVSGRVLTADAMNAHNTFDRPDAVQPRPFDAARLAGDTLTLDLPAKSIVVLELQ
jgi:alpha-N-arabinofuranosidase